MTKERANNIKFRVKREERGWRTGRCRAGKRGRRNGKSERKKFVKKKDRFPKTLERKKNQTRKICLF